MRVVGIISRRRGLPADRLPVRALNAFKVLRLGIIVNLLDCTFEHNKGISDEQMGNVLRQGRVDSRITKEFITVLIDRNWQIIVHIQYPIFHASFGRILRRFDFGSVVGALIDVSADGIIPGLVDPSHSASGQVFVCFELTREATFRRSPIIDTFTNDTPTAVRIGDAALEKRRRCGEGHHDGCHYGKLIVNEPTLIEILGLERDLEAAAPHSERHCIHVDGSPHIFSIAVPWRR
mmetsp:Transcript_6641/g.18552  ORF Transcript_6641/g.18552 Transcript_6641/m.18552 type:complete len:235 (+) Transcript_6641:989-1693(+)